MELKLDSPSLSGANTARSRKVDRRAKGDLRGSGELDIQTERGGRRKPDAEEEGKRSHKVINKGDMNWTCDRCS